MLQFYLARVAAYTIARLIIPTVWWFSPNSLKPLIEFNGWWVRVGMDYLIASAPAQVGKIVSYILVFTDKVGALIQWTLRWYVAPEMKDRVEVLAKAFFTPGGWVMVAQLTFIVFVMIRVARFALWRYGLHKWRRAERKEPTF